MTTLVQIDPSAAPVAGPSRSSSGRPFAESGEEGDPDLATVVRRVRTARRVVVICGAGVSTHADIPDFRSSVGLFAGAKGGSVKDLFHVKSLSSPSMLSQHHSLINDLHRMAVTAQPTPFHAMLAELDSDGRLLRCYTQNIDGLEERAGLSTGIPVQMKRTSSKKGKERSVPSGTASEAATSEDDRPGALGDIGPTLNPDPPSYPPAPRCIPLHGLLNQMHCTLCATKQPIGSHLPLPASAIPCPECSLDSSIRSALSERSRKVGTLRASVVLYGEEHPEGEQIGAVVERDLRGTGRRGEKEGRADLLLVAGSSLSIPGVKRIIKEMAKALATRTPGSVRDGKAPPVRVVYINNEPPSKPAEWDGVFDVWAQGDIQRFAELVADQSFAPPLPVTPRKSTPRKRTGGLPTPNTTPTKPRARKASTNDGSGESTPSKRSKTSTPVLPLTPRPTPPRPRPDSSSFDRLSMTRDSSPSPERQEIRGNPFAEYTARKYQSVDTHH